MEKETKIDTELLLEERDPHVQRGSIDTDTCRESQPLCPINDLVRVVQLNRCHHDR